MQPRFAFCCGEYMAKDLCPLTSFYDAKLKQLSKLVGPECSGGTSIALSLPRGWLSKQGSAPGLMYQCSRSEVRRGN